MSFYRPICLLLPCKVSHFQEFESEKIMNCFAFDGNQEARALGYNHVAQGAFLIGTIFTMTALLRLAINQAGCSQLPDDVQCENRVYGSKPSSLLNLMTTFSGLIGGILMPLVGAIVDHTNYRRAVGIGSAVGLVCNSLISICISERTWFFVAIVATNPFYYIHVTVMLAYIPELTKDFEKQARFNASFLAIRSISMLLSAFAIVLISLAFPGKGARGSLSHDIRLARISQIYVSTLCLLFFFLTFHKGLKPRLALSEIPEGERLMITGIKKVLKTTLTLYNEYPAVLWFLIASICYMSLVTAILTVAVTFMVDFLSMNGTETVVTMIIFLISAICGSLLMPVFTRIFGLFRGLKVACLFLMTLMILTPLVVSGPEHKKLMYFVVVFWGIAFGWIVPSGRLVFIAIMPKGQESEMMGLHQFTAIGFVWFPPLVLAILNENGIGINIGMMVCSIFCFFALFSLHMIGDFDEAVKKTETTGHFDEVVAKP